MEEDISQPTRRCAIAPSVFRLYAPNGAYLTSLQPVSYSYTLAENAVGVCNLVLPPIYPVSLFPLESFLRIERSVGGGLPALVGNTRWFVRVAADEGDESTLLRTLVTAYDANTVLDRREILYYSGSDGSHQEAEAYDDQLKRIIRENYSSSAADAARQLSSSVLSVQANVTAAPLGDASYAWDHVLTTLQKLAAESAQAGTYLSFALEEDGAGGLVFKTWTGQRGMDHRQGSTTASPVILRWPYGGIMRYSRRFDGTAEVNASTVGGGGEGAARVLGYAEDAARMVAGPYARFEEFYEKTDTQDTGTLDDTASGRVRVGRPRLVLELSVQDSPALQFGLHYGFGDLITAQIGQDRYDCRLYAFTIRGDESGLETIEPQLRVLEDGV